MNLFKLPLVLLLPVILLSCSKDEDLQGYTYYSESTIFSSGSTVQFREVLLVIKPYILSGQEKKYLVSDTLLNVTIKMNSTLWGTVNSLSLDTSVIETEVSGNFLVTKLPLKYSIIGRFEPEKTELTTAGEYSDLLRNYMTIEPGVYFCRVESFEIKMKDGSLKKVVPLISEMIEIGSDTRSLFLGEFEVEVK